MTDYRHKKTGTLYRKLSDAIDCTNSRDGTPVVIYERLAGVNELYVRDAKEFDEKFEPIQSSDKTTGERNA